jgi:hypothetical protein
MIIRDAVAAAWRKTVAAGVGGFLAWLDRRWGIVLDAESSQAAVIGATAVYMAVYGAIINFLEVKVPKLGWFLGLAKQPQYEPAPRRAGSDLS